MAFGAKIAWAGSLGGKIESSNESSFQGYPALLVEVTGLVGPRQQLRGRAAYPIAEERVARLRDGREVRVRPTRTRDFRAVQDLFYRMPEEDVRTRFFQTLTALTDVAAHLDAGELLG